MNDTPQASPGVVTPARRVSPTKLCGIAVTVPSDPRNLKSPPRELQSGRAKRNKNRINGTREIEYEGQKDRKTERGERTDAEQVAW